MFLFEEAVQEMFWWSVFDNRLLLSKFLWKNCRNKIALALIAEAVCGVCMDAIPRNEVHLLEQYAEMQQLYKTYSLGLLKEGTHWDLTSLVIF